MWRESSLNTVPPRGQRSPFLVSQDAVMILCTMFGYDMLKGSWELFGLAIIFGWLSQSNGLQFENAVWNICSAWSDDHICQVSWRLDRICGLWKCTIDFDIFQNGSQILMGKNVLELFGEVWQYHQTLKNKLAIHLWRDYLGNPEREWEHNFEFTHRVTLGMMYSLPDSPGPEY